MSFLNFDPPLIAHRGASAFAPENTLAAFQHAKDLGATWVEFDVMLAACGEAIIIHDDTLERTTNGVGDVAKHPYQYLKTLDAGSWFGLEFSNQCIPTLKQTLDFLVENHMSANIEIKSMSGQESPLVTKVVEHIKQFWPSSNMPPLISSFSLPILFEVRKQMPNAFIGVLIHEWFKGWEKVCKELNCFSVHVNEEILTLNKIRAIKEMDKKVLSYTVNTVKRAHELFSQGVDALFTDEFPLLYDALFL